MNGQDRPTVSVVVPCYNSMRYVDACFRAVARSTYPVLETIAVDDASTDGTPEQLQERFPEVTLIRAERNRGFAVTANLGLRRAAGELVALLNVDTEVSDTWLENLVAAYRSDPAIGILGCRMTDAEGRVSHDGGAIGPTGLAEHRVEDAAEGVHDVEYACGAGLLIEKKLLERLDYLDEGYAPMYYEDVDLCRQAHRLGRRVCCTTGAVMRHYESNDTGRETARYRRRFHTSRVRYVLKQFPAGDLLRWPWQEALYFFGRHAVGARGDLLRAYARNLWRLPGTLASRFRR